MAAFAFRRSFRPAVSVVVGSVALSGGLVVSRRRSVVCRRRPGLGLRLGRLPVFPRPVAPAAVVPPVRVLWSAFRAGSLASVVLRSSSRALSGAVLVCSFRSSSRAGRFAGRWAGRLGVSVRVARVGLLWAVSVPVVFVGALPAPVSVAVAVVGGVRGCAAVAAALLAVGAPLPPPVLPSGGGSSFGFCGSRSLPRSFAPVVRGVVASLPAGASVSVGCASGADSLVRAAVPAAHVWSVVSGGFGGGRVSFARRSAALVRALPVACGWFVGFVSSSCPAGVVPSRSWSSGASVSGSWSSLALAAGRGVRVAVAWCGAGAPVLPAWGGGAWVSFSRAPWSGAALPASVSLWVWSPVAAPSLLGPGSGLPLWDAAAALVSPLSVG